LSSIGVEILTGFV